MIEDIDKELSKSKSDALIVIGDSTYGNPSLAYVVGAVATRGGIYIKNTGGKPLLIVSEIDIGTSKKGLVQDIRSYSQFGYLGLAQELGEGKAKMEVCVRALKELDLRGKVCLAGKVEAGTALSWAEYLKNKGFTVSLDEDLVDRVRMTKDNIEVGKIRDVGRKTEKVVIATIKMLTQCKADKEGKLKSDNGKSLTVGDVKAFIRMRLAEENLVASEDTIFAQGAEGADPHNPGVDSTVIRNNTPIVYDIFPQQVGGYCFDTTRTIVIGKASEEVKKAYTDVLESQLLALSDIKAGVQAKEVMRKVCEFLASRGHKTPIYYTEKNAPMTDGFIHGLGHGVGLTIGEPPTLRLTSRDILTEGTVTTVEPGVYYPGKFGVRVEDIAIARKNKAENLSTLPKELEV
ncbi:MAG: Xaa-Pro peptidase family protein [Promethearchaeati archaeon SRVP18_Atabeyarchaeia-1]